MTIQRATLLAPTSFEGMGLHSGVPVTVVVNPSDQGIVFRCGSEVIEARPENIIDTSFCTKLGSIATIEHIMSALAGYEITDAEIVLSAPELPALDGSALPYYQEFLRVGKDELGQRELPDLYARTYEHEDDAKIAIGAGNGHWRYEFFSEEKYPYCQAYESLDVVAEFAKQIAPARTFGWQSECAAIQDSGLAQGLSLDTVLVLGDNGPINEPRFETEPCRHKLLDAIGDLYLAGIPIRFLNVVCQGSGHKLNIQAAKKLADQLAR